ncbi:unnamed protein product [Lasius platythorax]|uniref:Uncharacterized protein n=1 Tax=Lasius platythorax TaxID=488582 RepID=A0AAV2NMJ1_9HYME
MQDLEEQERELQGVPDRVIAGEQGAAGQADQSVASQRKLPATQRLNLRDRNSIKPPPRYEVNVAEHIPKTFKEATSGSDGDKWTRYNRARGQSVNYH